MAFRSPEQLSYEYNKLSEPDAVRLIQLHPSPHLESPLQCELLSTTLARCYNNLIDKYTALSYVWGDPQLSSKITVDGRTMLITASLASALRHLRDSTRKRIIWADAICINQRDTLERSQQVSQMNSVYFLAHHTIIYLGDSTPATDQILNDLRSRSLILATQKFSRLSAIRGELDKGTERAALESIFSRPWFKRVWVLQELVLSLDPWLQCGTSLARWHDFREYISSTGLAQGMEGARVASEMANLHLKYSKMRHETVHGYMREITAKDIAKQLLEILISRRAFGVQDPRDMIFAHLGLIDERDPRSVLLTVDYLKSKRTVYTQVATYLLDNLYNYSILSLAEGSGERDKDLPSWTPDWRVPGPPVTIYSALGLDRELRRTKIEEASFSSDHFGHKYILVAQHQVLACVGSKIGSLCNFGSVIQTCPESQDRLRQDKQPKNPSDKEFDLWKHIEMAFKKVLDNWTHLQTPKPWPKEFLKNLASVIYKKESYLKNVSDCYLYSKFHDKASQVGMDVHVVSELQYICDELQDIPCEDRSTVHWIQGNDILFKESDKRPDSNNPELSEFERTVHRSDLDTASLIFQYKVSFRIILAYLEQSLLVRILWAHFDVTQPNIFHGRRLATLQFLGASTLKTETYSPALALVPASTCASDVVCIVQHYLNPVVLRPLPQNAHPKVAAEIKERLQKENRYSENSLSEVLSNGGIIEHFELVGECFVENMMLGSSLYQDFASEEIEPGSRIQILAIH